MSVETTAGPGVTQAPAAPPSERRGHPGWLLAVCCVAQFMVILDLSIVNVALPSIQFSLGFTAPDLQWVVDAYAITFAGFLMFGGRAADHFGQRRTFVAALALFGLFALVAAFTWWMLARGSRGAEIVNVVAVPLGFLALLVAATGFAARLWGFCRVGPGMQENSWLRRASEQPCL